MSGRETIRGKHGAGALLSLGWSRMFETRLKKEKKKTTREEGKQNRYYDSLKKCMGHSNDHYNEETEREKIFASFPYDKGSI